MASEKDQRVGFDVATAIASALEAGWNLEEILDLVEDMYPQMVEHYARHIALEALSTAMMTGSPEVSVQAAKVLKDFDDL